MVEHSVVGIYETMAQAEEAGVAVDAVIEDALRRAIEKLDIAGAEARAGAWAAENAEAIDDYNRRIRERGLIGDEFRKW